jgi:hypothetical protein
MRSAVPDKELGAGDLATTIAHLVKVAVKRIPPDYTETHESLAASDA